MTVVGWILWFCIVGSIQVLWCYLMYDVMMIMIRLMCVCVWRGWAIFWSNYSDFTRAWVYIVKRIWKLQSLFFPLYYDTMFNTQVSLSISCLLILFWLSYLPPVCNEVNISVVDTIMEMRIKRPHPIGYNLVSTYSGIGHIPIDWWRCVYA